MHNKKPVKKSEKPIQKEERIDPRTKSLNIKKYCSECAKIVNTFSIEGYDLWCDSCGSFLQGDSNG